MLYKNKEMLVRATTMTAHGEWDGVCGDRDGLTPQQGAFVDEYVKSHHPFKNAAAMNHLREKFGLRLPEERTVTVHKFIDFEVSKRRDRKTVTWVKADFDCLVQNLPAVETDADLVLASHSLDGTDMWLCYMP